MFFLWLVMLVCLSRSFNYEKQNKTKQNKTKQNKTKQKQKQNGNKPNQKNKQTNKLAPKLEFLNRNGCSIKFVVSNLKIINSSLTLKEPGFLDPSHSRGGGGFRPPLRSRKPIDETSSVWY